MEEVSQGILEFIQLRIFNFALLLLISAGYLIYEDWGRISKVFSGFSKLMNHLALRFVDKSAKPSKSKHARRSDSDDDMSDYYRERCEREPARSRSRSRSRSSSRSRSKSRAMNKKLVKRCSLCGFPPPPASKRRPEGSALGGTMWLSPR